MDIIKVKKINKINQNKNKIICECGVKILEKNYEKHIKSKTHIKFAVCLI